MLKKKIFRVMTIAALVVPMAFPPEIFGAQTVKRVVFAKGKTTSVYKGKLAHIYEGYDSYLLRGKKGQTLGVILTSAHEGAIVAIYELKVLGPEEDAIVGNDEKLREWSGKLPVSSDYEVQVYVASTSDRTRSGAAYKIEISLR